MSTYLELVQGLGVECGISGSGPSTVTGNSGENARLVRWIAAAYVELQNRYGGRWDWLRSDFTIDTVADQDTYAFADATDVDSAVAISRFSSWKIDDMRNPPRIYLTSAGVGGETWMAFTKFYNWSALYSIGTQNSQFPIHIAVDPRDKIRVGPKPNDIYTITGQYWKAPQVLAADSDTPEMPSQYHDLIIYLAMEKYASFESAPEVETRAIKESRKLMRQLEINQGPRFRKHKTLA